MNFLRLHWFDIGLVLAGLTGLWILSSHPAVIALLLWLSLITLFLHQFEEYRYPGYFPGMLNKALFASPQPDRYPLNLQIALIISVFVGWLPYFLAAVFTEKALWLGIATILVSAGNFIAHTFLFNFKGRSRYNPGMLTADILFLPIAAWFFYLVIGGSLASSLDWVLGIVLGIALNVIGILKLIDWLKNKKTPHIFPERFLMKE